MGSRAAQSVSSAVVQTAFSPPIWDPWAHRRRTGPRGRAARWAPGLAPCGVRAADALLPDAEQLREPPARSPRTPLLGAQCRATGRGGKWRPRRQGVFLLGRARCPEHVQPSFLPKQSPLRGGLRPQAQRWWLPGGARLCQGSKQVPIPFSPINLAAAWPTQHLLADGHPRCLPADTWATTASWPAHPGAPRTGLGNEPCPTPASLQLPGPPCSAS